MVTIETTQFPERKLYATLIFTNYVYPSLPHGIGISSINSLQIRLMIDISNISSLDTLNKVIINPSPPNATYASLN